MKGQTLPWVAINVVGMVVLIIVLVVILSLQKNVSMTTKELDLRSTTMMMLREFITSPNCVSYETSSYYYLNGSNPRILFYQINHPGVIDVSKYKNFYHFNCLRYDSNLLRKEITYAYETSLVDAQEEVSVQIPLWGGIITLHKVVNFGLSKDGSYFPPNGSTYSYEIQKGKLKVAYGSCDQHPCEFLYKQYFFPDSNDTMEIIQPVLIKYENRTHLGILRFRVILDKNENFTQVNIWGGSVK